MATANAVNANSSGIQVYDGTSTFFGRTLTGTTNQIAVSNGTGISDNPTIALDTKVVISTQPCMAAYLSSTQNNKTGNGTFYTLIYDTVIFDQNSNYNSVTGVFTAPVTGKYWFSTQAKFSNVGSSTWLFELYLQRSDGLQWRGSSEGPVNSASTTGRFVEINSIVPMTSGQTFTTFVIVTGQGADTVGVAGGATNPVTWLTCKLLC